MRVMADGLGLVRIAAAAAFPVVFSLGGWWALVLFALAAASDYVDGPLARRAGGASRYGVLLDGGADVVFVSSAATTGALAGLVPWIAPLAIAAAGGAYLLASAHGTSASPRPERAYSRIGHAAGVTNYVLAGLVAGVVAVPWAGWGGVLRTAGLLASALNLAALAQRWWPAPRADASRV